uniref:Uncharacterized protein n=1 Tax=Anguilla anguilla TaxID=7936 RepID=A0A0E9QVT1_ANGAN
MCLFYYLDLPLLILWKGPCFLVKFFIFIVFC